MPYNFPSISIPMLTTDQEKIFCCGIFQMVDGYSCSNGAAIIPVATSCLTDQYYNIQGRVLSKTYFSTTTMHNIY